ncbi:hypothetical protein ACIG3E_33155 [Streptomyces sp. NPDC053474]|uniref:hypothetical protein n=1 Tax=Streptomyces sp. NPDC053474 TaxID=3365704 RepID=UPI0037D49461
MTRPWPPQACRVSLPRAGGAAAGHIATGTALANTAEDPRRLCAWRQAQQHRLTRTPTQSRVLAYVLVRSAQDFSGRLALARRHAEGQGLHVVRTVVEEHWRTDPLLRPGLAGALAAIRRREADGLVCVSRTDISSSGALYVAFLHVLHGADGFLSLQRAETTP